MNILILHSQVLFTTGGAEVLVAGLQDALRSQGHRADIVALPLAWNPVDRLLTTALAWSLLDVTTFNGVSVDLVVCTKFPTWAVRHPRKVLWLIHQHRQAYDWYGTAMSEFRPDDRDRSIRDRVIEIDQRGIGSCTPRFAISRNVAGRLRRFCGIDADELYPPVPRRGLRPDAYDPFLLSVARLDRAKRVGAIISAWPSVRSDLKLVVVGDGPERQALERLSSASGLDGRVEFRGRVTDQELVRLYNRCRAVYYAPLDEDYGYATVEALAAGKSVLTAPDSGGVLEFVSDGENGYVIPLESRELAGAVNRLADEDVARGLGARGPRIVEDLTWDRVVDSLLAGSGT